MIRNLTQYLFRRHVTHRAHDHAGLSRDRVSRRSRQLASVELTLGGLARPKSRIFTRSDLVMKRFWASSRGAQCLSRAQPLAREQFALHTPALSVRERLGAAGHAGLPFQ